MQAHDAESVEIGTNCLTGIVGGFRIIAGWKMCVELLPSSSV